MAYKKILFRRDPASVWTSTNPVLSAGEIGLETDTRKIKLGNGSTAWNALGYFYGSLDNSSLNDIGDVTITSVQNGDFLRYNGSASVWINDPVNLSTDTVGSYVESLVAGTGVTLTNNSGEGATPTIAIGQAIGTSASPTFAVVSLSEQPSQSTHAATKGYVDNIASGVNWHEAVSYATTAVLPNTPTYDNGVDGVGATLTAGSNARLMVDGLNVSTGNRILVKNQSSQTQNGIYDVTAQGSVSIPWVLTRAADFNQNTLAGSIDTGEAVYVRLGNSNAGTGYVLTSTGTGDGDRHIPGTDNFVFTQFSGLTETVAGAGLTTNGTVLSVGTASSGRIVVNADDIDLATVAQSNSTDADGLFFAKTVNIDSYGRVTGVVSASVDLSSKANLANPTFSGTVVLPSTTSIGDVSSTEIGYLNNVTSAIQTQIDSKASSTTSPIITLGGDLSGSVALTNLGSGTLTATIAADSVALGTDTTGDYVATITGGTGVASTAAASGEGTTHTLSIGQAVGTNDNVTFAGVTADAIKIGVTAAGEIDTTSGNLTIDSAGGTVTVDDNLTVTGDLTVSGTTTSINTETLTVDDNIIVLNNNVTGSPTENAGIEIERGTSTNVLVRWNETNDKWELTNDGSTYGNIVTSGTIVNADINASAAIDLGKLADVSTNAQTASYTLVLTDKNKIVEMGVGSANNLTVPLNSSVAFPVGSQINILQTGAGQTTIVATGGVTINATPGLKIRAQWSYATLIKRATDTWVLVGDISA